MDSEGPGCQKPQSNPEGPESEAVNEKGELRADGRVARSSYLSHYHLVEVKRHTSRHRSAALSIEVARVLPSADQIGLGGEFQSLGGRICQDCHIVTLLRS